MDILNLRELLPSAKDFVFLNYAATAPMLKPSADYMSEIVQQGVEPLSEHFDVWLGIVESTRKDVADLIGASAEEITFTTNTSSALSLIAGSIEWNEGDRILFPSVEFPSNRYVWQNLSRKGVRAEPFDVQRDKSLVETIGNMNLDGVRLISLSVVSYLDGRRHNIEELVKLCHERMILVAVDAIQAVGAVEVDVHKWNCDFLACGGQKWLLGPVGSGFLYIKKDLLEDLHVSTVGWTSSKDAGDFVVKDLQFVDGARRFEAGLPDVAAVAGLSRSIETLKSFGWTNIFHEIKSHNQHLRDEIESLGYELINSNLEEDNAGIVSIKLSSNEDGLIHDLCLKSSVIITQRNKILRIAAHAATSDEDIQKILNILAQSKGKQLSRKPVVDKSTTIKSSMGNRQWKNALVTGASRGLGEGIAIALANRGCDLHLMARDKSRLNEVSKEIEEKYNVKVQVTSINFSNKSEVETWLNENQSNLNYDILINNAALGEAELFLDTDIHHVREAFEINFFTPHLLIQKILPGMIEREGGAILNVVTSGSRCALPLFSEYAASKGALWSLSETLSRETEGLGVSITTFLPPHMETATANRLGRKALGYYKMGNVRSNTTSPLKIGEKAVEALFNKEKTVVPLSVRLKLAMNALSPNTITKRVLANWRGLAS